MDHYPHAEWAVDHCYPHRYPREVPVQSDSAYGVVTDGPLLRVDSRQASDP